MSEPLPSAGNLAPAELATAIRTDLCDRIHSGERVRVEFYLEQFPHLGDDPIHLLDLLHAEAIQRETCGERVTVQEYVRRFPSHADALHRLFAVHAALRAGHLFLWTGVTSQLQAPPTEGPADPVTVDFVVRPPPTDSSSQPDRTDVETPRRTASAGEVNVPGYKVLGKLGQGGMGVVYKARHLRLGRVVALKMVLHAEHADEQELQRFLVEAEAVAHLDHPNVVQLYDSGTHNGLPYFTLEYMPGGSLADRLREKPLTAKEAAQLVRQVALGVQHAHDGGIVHRDLKPGNVLLGADGTPKVTDFGLARRVEGVSGLTVTGAILGTPSYMAPEHAQADMKKVGPPADTYAVGAILYECLTGRPPFRAATPMETLFQVMHAEPAAVRTLQPGVPRDLETICHKCLNKEPARRYASAAELAEDLGRFLAGEPVRARPVGPMERAARWVRRRPAIAALTATVVLVALVGAALVAVNWRNAVYHRGKAEEEARRANEAADAERQAREEADEEWKRAERNLYFNRVALAQREWENNHVGTAMDLLDACPPARRDWEWHYLRRLWHGTPMTLHGHTDRVNAVAFSPDGTRIASAGGDSTVKLWDARTGQETLTLKGHTAAVTALAWSPDGARLVTSSADLTVKLWDVQTGKDTHTLKGQSKHLTGVCFSPDGTRIASSSLDQTVKLWDAHTGQETLTFKGHTGSVQAVCFSPDGTRLASAGFDQAVKVWDARTGKEQISLKGHTSTITAVAWSPDGVRLATAAGDSTVKLWDTRTGQETLTFKGHTSIVTAVCFRPDGMSLASSSFDNTVKVWDARTGQESLTLKGHTSLVTAVAFSPDGARLASAGRDQTVKVWDARASQEALTLKGHVERVTAVAFSSDGTRLASTSWDSTVRVWDAQTGREQLTLRGHTHPVRAAVFSRDGAWIASASEDRTVKVWDARSGKEASTLEGHTLGVMSVAFTPDGARLASASHDGTVRLWNVRTRQVTLTLKGHKGGVNGIAFSPDGARLASAGEDMTVKVWDARTGREQLTLKGHTEGVTAVVFSLDGARLGSGSRDQTVKMWDTQTGQEALALLGHAGSVTGVAFSPDGKRLASSSMDQTVKVWDTQTGQEALTLRGHLLGVPDVAFSPDGRRIASASMDQTVKVWDARTRREPLTLKGHMTTVRAVAFTPDGTQVSAVDAEGMWKTWDPGSGKQVEARPLPDAPRQRSAWSPDGRTQAIATGNTVRLVDAHPPDEEREEIVRLSAPDAGWHREQARQAEANRNAFAVAFHAERLLAIQPDDPEPYLLRANLHAGSGKWTRAVEDFAHVAERFPDRADLVALARAQLGAGEREACRETLRRLARRHLVRRSAELVGLAWGVSPLDRFTPTLIARLKVQPLAPARVEANMLAELAVVCGDVPGNVEELLELTRHGDAFYRGPVLCRAGQHADAARLLARSEEMPASAGRTFLRLFAALAEHGRGNAEAARRALFQATTWLDAPDKRDPKQSNFAGLDWGMRVEMEALRRECEQKLGILREPGRMNPIAP